MSESTDIQNAKEQATIMAKLSTMEASLKELTTSFNDFRSGIGKRLGEVEGFMGKPKDSLAVLENKVDTIMWVLRGVATPVLGSIGISILGFLVWHFVHKG